MSRDTIRLPHDAYRLLQTLRAAGHSAYVVGGCVRDSCWVLPPMTGIFAPAPCRSREWSCSAKKNAFPPACSTAP